MKNLLAYKLLTSIFFFFFFFIRANAQERLLPTVEYEAVPLEKMINTAEAVFEGRVVSQHTFKQGGIFTAHRIEIYKVFKGNIAAPYVELITVGGWYGDIGMELSHGQLKVGVGSTGIFTGYKTQFLDSNATVPENLRFNAHYGDEGFIRYDPIQKIGVSAYKIYENISPYLYNKISQLTGKQPQVIKDFDFEKWDYQQERREAAEKEKHSEKTSKKKQTQPQIEKVAAVAISTLSPLTITAGTYSELTINGTDFGTVKGSGAVYFRNAEDGGATIMEAPAEDITLWTNTQIKVRVPSNNSQGQCAGTGTVMVVTDLNTIATSTQTLTITRAEKTYKYPNYNNYRQVRLKDRNNNGGYTFRYDPAFYSNVPAVAAFQRSLQTWRCGTNVNFGDNCQTIAATSGALAPPDNINHVFFSNDINLFPSSNPNRKAVTLTYYSICALDFTNQNGYVYISEMDIAFRLPLPVDPVIGTVTWNYGPTAPASNQFDFQTAATHELGHAHGLDHVIDASNLMHYTRSAGSSVRTLNTNAGYEKEGGLNVLSRSQTAYTCTNIANYTPMTLLTSATCQGANVSVSQSTTSTLCSSCYRTFTASGAASYCWSPATGLNTTSGSTVVSQANTTTTYTVFGSTNGLGSVVSVTDNRNPQCLCAPPPVDSPIGGGDDARLSVYPNPNTGSFSVAYSAKALGRAEKLRPITVEAFIYNSLGVLVKRQKLNNSGNQNAAEVSGLPNGAYMIKVIADGVPEATERIIVAK